MSVVGAVVLPPLNDAVSHADAPGPYCTLAASPLSDPPPEFVTLTDCGDGAAPPMELKLTLAGAIAIRGRATTVTFTVRDAPSDVAVTIDVPAAMPVTRPEPSTVVTVKALDDHVTGRAVSARPLVLFGVAASADFSPTVRVSEVGFTSIDVTGSGASEVVVSTQPVATIRQPTATVPAHRRGVP